MRKILFYIFTILLLFTLSACFNTSTETKEPTITETTPIKDSYTLTFLTEHGETPNKISDIKKIPQTLPTLQKEGWEFEGWYYDTSFTKKAFAYDTITKDTYLYAKWTMITYMISFENNGHGQQIETISNITKLPSTLPILEEIGWSFEGWYYDNNYTSIANPLDELKSNVTLYAKWSINTFTISFNINNHGEQPLKIENVSKIPTTLPILEDSDYNFVGWYYDNTFTKPVNENDDIKSNITLYAKWSKKKYTINFITTLSTQPEPLTNVNRIPYNLPTLNDKHYSFDGWYMDSNFSTPVQQGSTINSNINLYAKWTKIAFNVSFVSEFSTNPETLENISKLPTTLPYLTYEGYQFVGWYYDEELEIKAAPGDKITTDTILFAKWEIIPEIDTTFTITFNNNGHGEPIDSLYEQSNLPIQLPELSETGYIFLGWFLDEEFRYEAYPSSFIFQDTTLYAKWQKLYNITYETNGYGILDPVNNVLTLPNILPELSQNGYMFGGWYTDVNLTIKANPGSEINSDITLYAKWTLITYSISFETSIGTTPTTINETITIPTLPTLSNDKYNFIGWYLDENYTTLATEGMKLNSDITLYAKWEIKTYNLTYENNGIGQEITPSKVSKLPETLPTLSFDGYRFDGWYYDEDFTDLASPNDDLTSDTILYAKWTEIVSKPKYGQFKSEFGAINSSTNGTDLIFSYNTSPKWDGLYIDVTNYNSDFFMFEIIFSNTHSFEICLETLVNNTRTHTSHKPYQAGENQIFTVNLNQLNTSESFRILLYIDANLDVTVTKTLTFHSVRFYNPSTPDDDISSEPTYDETSQTYTVKYAESNETFSNPDRGFYNAKELLGSTTGLEQLASKYLYRNNLIHLRINIGQFSGAINGGSDLELTSAFLNDLDKLLKSIDDADACAIIRFAYTYKSESDKEPSINMILKHIEQFVPIINKYAHIFSALECGMVGPWGEMHSSAIATQDTWNKIFDKYLSVLDEKVKFLVRQPNFIYKYYGYTLKTLDKFDYANCNRIGCYNDGYLGSSSDLGTFDDREKEIIFLQKLESFPYGGEVVKRDDGNNYNQLWHSWQEMFKTNLSYLNIAWNDTVIARWQNTPYTLDDPLYQDKSEFDYINNHLGYRFVCQQLNYKITDSFTFTLSMKNVGFGIMYKQKKGYVILKNNSNTYKFECNTYNQILDDYFTLTGKVNLSNLPRGEYEVYYVLAENFTTSAIRGIRFANYNMYNEELNANKITTISI